MPSSVMTSRYPSATCLPMTATLVSGAEKEVAFSMSSANRWATSLTHEPFTFTCSSSTMSTRSNDSTADTAARTTSPTTMGSDQLRAFSAPASTNNDSALRRIRVARWSTRNRSSSLSGSRSLRSNSVSRARVRPSRAWLRRPRFTRFSDTLRRATACWEANETAVDCMDVKALANCSSSSPESNTIGSMVGTGSSAPTT